MRQRLLLSLPTALILAGLIAPHAHASACIPMPPYASEADRIGYNVITDHGKTLLNYNVAPLKAGWYVDYQSEPRLGAAALRLDAAGPDVPTPDLGVAPLPLSPAASQQADLFDVNSLSHMPVLRLADLAQASWQSNVAALVDSNPGSLWVIGNEMDRVGQDGLTPGQYAAIYRRVYQFIKQRDPSSRVAVGAVVQPTPIRRRYLDTVLEEYQRRFGVRMPVDMWTVHAFILREKLGDETCEECWGASIPPGLEAYAGEGMIYDVADHGDIEIMKGLVREFRMWMAQHGYRNTPLVVSEYGILMPPDYDAGNGRVYDTAFVNEYMLASFEFFRTAVDAQTGYPNDGNRLVQAWSWYSLNDYIYSYPDRMDGFNGNLLEHDSGALTPFGTTFAAYAGARSLDYVDMALRRVNVSRTSIPSGTEGITLTVDASVFNRGNLPANRARLRFWLGEPGSGKLLAEKALAAAVLPRCHAAAGASVSLRLPALPTGFHQLVVEIVDTARPDAIAGNERATFVLRVGDPTELDAVFMPFVSKP